MSKEKIEEMTCVSCIHQFVCLMYSDHVQSPCSAFENKADYHQQSGWISVEERLPQVTGKYICCVKDKGGNTWTVPADWNLEMKMWFGEFGEIKNMVTHWMPLPDPPMMKGGAE